MEFPPFSLRRNESFPVRNERANQSSPGLNGPCRQRVLRLPCSFSSSRCLPSPSFPFSKKFGACREHSNLAGLLYIRLRSWEEGPVDSFKKEQMEPYRLETLSFFLLEGRKSSFVCCRRLDKVLHDLNLEISRF